MGEYERFIRDYAFETKKRVEFIQDCIAAAGASGIIFGNSGGKDCALVGILCKMACGNTLGLMMPCGTKQNYGSDIEDAKLVAEQFHIENRMVDLTKVKEAALEAITKENKPTDAALINIAPRLRMTTLYAVAASENRLVAGTCNRSERHMGYYTKWGDGAFDFNPIANLTATEVYEFLRHLHAPESLFAKAPSGGLFDGQTDETEMGISYDRLDTFLLTGKATEEDKALIKRSLQANSHKREGPRLYSGAT